MKFKILISQINYILIYKFDRQVTNHFFFFSCQVVEDGYEFFAKRQLVTLFSAPNYCGEFDNAGAMMSVDETLMCSFQILKVIFVFNKIPSGRDWCAIYF